jgi:hypothetical protein
MIEKSIAARCILVVMVMIVAFRLLLLVVVRMDGFAAVVARGGGRHVAVAFVVVEVGVVDIAGVVVAGACGCGW